MCCDRLIYVRILMGLIFYFEIDSFCIKKSVIMQRNIIATTFSEMPFRMDFFTITAYGCISEGNGVYPSP